MDKSFTMQDFRSREAAVFAGIPGMQELLKARPKDRDRLSSCYPDAAFVSMIADNLSLGDAEQNAIHQKAYLAILAGEPIQNVRFRYDFDLEQYLEQHMWD